MALRFFSDAVVDELGPAPALTPACGVFSYAGQLSFGVSTDLARLPNPRGLLEAFRSELEELQRLAPEPEPAASEPLPDVMG